MTAQIDILLATYNGARFLPEQLQSLLDQTHRDWRLIVRDDGSTDGSLELVKDWAAQNGVNLKVLDDGLGNLGACGSFGKLLEATDAPYFACCDQDDVWLPAKLESMLKALRQAEATSGTDTPLLAYSDLVVVNEKLEEIAPSFRAYCSIGSVPPATPIRKILIHNVVTGCAAMGNNAIARVACPIPDGARMHDWWLALVACEFGQMVDVPEALILYRQHGKNTMGALRLDLMGILLRFIRNPVRILKQRTGIVVAEKEQSRAFHLSFADRLDSYSRELTGGYGSLDERNAIYRRLFVMKHRLRRHNLLSQLTYLLVV